MSIITLILLVFAFVLFALAGLGTAEQPRFRFIGWGLACATLAVILERAAPLVR